jgi:hypothetical protein
MREKRKKESKRARARERERESARARNVNCSVMLHHSNHLSSKILDSLIYVFLQI